MKRILANLLLISILVNLINSQNVLYTGSEELRHLNDGEGLDGICRKTFRIIKAPTTSPKEYCYDFYNSDLGTLQDLAGLYNSILSSSKPESPLSIVMDDMLGKWWMKLDFYFTNQVFLSPELVTSKTSDHILCVQKIKCPKKATTTTTTTTSTTTSTTTTPRPQLREMSNYSDEGSSGLVFTNNQHQPLSVWDIILTETDPRSWVISTILLSIFSLILFVALVMVSICFCRIKSAHYKEKCYGTSATPISTRINNGTLRSNGGSTYQPLHRNGNTGQWMNLGKSTNHIFVGLGNEGDANGMLTSQCQNETLTRNWNNSNKRSRRLSQEAIHRSISEGSSVSGHTAPPSLLLQKNSLIQNTTSKLMNFMQNSQNRTSPHDGNLYQPVTYLGSNIINGPYLNPGSPNKSSSIFSRKENARYFMKGNIDEADEDNEHIQRHMTISNMSEARSHKEVIGENEGELMNISPPMGFFDQSQLSDHFSNGGVQFSGMMGSTGSFLSNNNNNITSHNNSKSTKHSLLSNGWSNCSSPHNGDIPTLPPRDGCSDESNDSGKSSGHPSASTTNGLPKLSNIFTDCGPPIVAQAPNYSNSNRSSNYT